MSADCKQSSLSPLFGLAPGGVYHAAAVAGRAVRSYRTLSPLPAEAAQARIPNRRFAFCGTFPGVAPAGCYPAPSSHGARTFLDLLRSANEAAVIRPSGEVQTILQSGAVKLHARFAPTDA